MSSAMFDILAYNSNIWRFFYGYTYEVAHWWVPGTVVFTGKDGWFNMAFPAYFSLKYAETVSDEEYRALRNYYISAYWKWTDYGNKEIPLVDVENVYMSDIYLAYGVGAYKGALVLEKLENYTGREAFYAALGEFFKENTFKEGHLEDFVRLLEQKSGKEVVPLFCTLTTSTGLPT
jgi:aminopeptidase N